MAQHSGYDTRRGLIPEDLMKFKLVEELVLDPTATRVAYTVKQADAATNGYIIHVFVRALAETTAHKLTNGVGRAGSIAWSKDGSRLAYGWSAEGKHSVHIWDAASGVEQVYAIPGEPLGSLDWSPDGQRLAGVRWTRFRADDERQSRPDIPAPTIKIVRRLRYKQDGAGWVHDRYTQIWVLELSTGELVQVTDSEVDYSEPSWSQAGDRLAFIGLAREQNIELGQGQIFIAEYPTGKLSRLLPHWAGACRCPQWGDDDRSIAFAGHQYAAPVNRRNFMQVYLADVQAGTARHLAELDQEVGNYAVSDSRKGLSNITVKWPHGDGWIYFLLTVRGATHLYRINTQGQVECLVDGPRVVFEYSPAQGDVVAYGMADPTNPNEVYVQNATGTQVITALNPWLADHQLAAPEEYHYEGVDGTKVHAWLMLPHNFDPTHKYPAVVYVHCSMFSWDFSLEFQGLVSAGYVLTYFNQRGTTAGYGQAWTHASQGDQGGRDYQEIMLGVDHLIQRPYVDARRLGVTGGSCGGFMTNWIVGHNDRFAAAVTQRSISNQISFFGSSDIGPECTEGETGTNPWRDLAASWQQSPLAHMANVNTPLLILQYDEDHRCPMEQGEQIFALLRWMGKEVEMVVFEGENHGLTRGGRPGNRIAHMRCILGWFEKYMIRRP